MKCLCTDSLQVNRFGYENLFLNLRMKYEIKLKIKTCHFNANIKWNIVTVTKVIQKVTYVSVWQWKGQRLRCWLGGAGWCNSVHIQVNCKSAILCFYVSLIIFKMQAAIQLWCELNNKISTSKKLQTSLFIAKDDIANCNGYSLATVWCMEAI